MALTFVVASLDGLPDDVKPLYKKRDDGKFQLDVDGAADKAKLDEFRATNIALKESVEKLTADIDKFKDMDPAKYKNLLEQIQSQEEKKLIKDGNIDEVIKLRTAALTKDRDEQLAAKDKIISTLQDGAKKATQEKDSYIVEAEMRKALDNPELGFQPGVANILKDSVLKEFIHKDGKVVRVKPDGSLVFGKSGDPQGLDEYVQGYAKEHPYLVKPSTGGGAGHEKSSNGHGAKTMKRADFDRLDPAGRMDFTLAKKGVVVD